MKRLEILKFTQEELKKYLKEILIENGYKNKIINSQQYLFGIGEIPILLVAHLDTVHRQAPQQIFYDKKQKVLWSPQGIGGDDRCGVLAILDIIENYKPYVLFTTDEEKGGIGASQFTEDILLNLKDTINFIIEIDRRGNNDAVFYDCGNKEFKDYILSFGFEEAFGTFTDISILSPAYDIASVNLSSGYYNEHTQQEFINMADLQSTIDKVKNILADKENHKYYDYQEVVYTPVKKYYEDDWCWKNDYYDLSDKEFKDMYGYNKPATYEEFIGDFS